MRWGWSGAQGCHGRGLGRYLGAGCTKLYPLVVEDRCFVLHFCPGPRHWPYSVDVLMQAGVKCLFEVVNQSDVP